MVLQKDKDGEIVVKRINITFDSLPEMSSWVDPVLDRTFLLCLNNLSYFLFKQPDITVVLKKDHDDIIYTQIVNAMKRYNIHPDRLICEEIPLLSTLDLVIGIGLNQPSVDLINSSKNKCLLLKVSSVDLIPNNAMVFDEDLEFELSNLIKKIKEQIY